MAKQSENRNRLSPGALSQFCAEIVLILESGIMLYDGIEMLSESTQSGTNAAAYKALSGNIQRTGSLYEALKADPLWPRYLVEMVGIGERTGQLERVMRGLALYYEREGRIRNAIVSAITYPMMLGIMMLLILLIMVLKVLPVFRRVLGSLGISMTDSGNLLMRMGSNAGWVVLILSGAAVLLALLCLVLMRTKMRQRTLQALYRFIPPLRKLSRKLVAARSAAVLSMILSGGFPMEDALELIPSVLPNGEAARRIEIVRKHMAQGGSFMDGLALTKIFDPIHSSMIRIGIASGRQDQTMNKIAEIYEEQVEDGISNLVSIIEPTLVALLCIVIGAILMAVMLPMAGIISSLL